MARTGTWMHYNTDAAGATYDATLGVHGEYSYSAEIDWENNTTTVYAGPCVLAGIFFTEASSAHTCVLKDGTTTVLTLPASIAVATIYTFPGIKFSTSLVCDPDDSASAGKAVFLYRPL